HLARLQPTVPTRDLRERDEPLVGGGRTDSELATQGPCTSRRAAAALCNYTRFHTAILGRADLHDLGRSVGDCCEPRGLAQPELARAPGEARPKLSALDVADAG